MKNKKRFSKKLRVAFAPDIDITPSDETKLRVAFAPDIDITPSDGTIRVIHFKEDDTHVEKWGICAKSIIKKGNFVAEDWWPVRFVENEEDATKLFNLYIENKLTLYEIESYQFT